MLFPTIDFGLFFALSLALVWSLNSQNNLKKAVLLALSLAFYASWNWRFLLLLLVVPPPFHDLDAGLEIVGAGHVRHGKPLIRLVGDLVAVRSEVVETPVRAIAEVPRGVHD